MNTDRTGSNHIFRRRPGVVVVLVAAVAIAAVVLGDVYTGRGGSAKQAAIEAARALGEPVSLAELDAWQPGGAPPADAFLRALDNVVDVPPIGRFQLPAPGAPFDDRLIRDLRSLVELNDGALGLLHEAGARPEVRWPVQFAAYPNIDFAYLGEVSRAVRLLALAAVFEALEQRPEAAFARALDALRVAQSIAREPFLIAQLHRVAALRACFEMVQHLFSQVRFTDPQLDGLLVELRRAYPPDSFYRALVGERCLVFEDTSAWGMGPYFREAEKLIAAARQSPEAVLDAMLHADGMERSMLAPQRTILIQAQRRAAQDHLCAVEQLRLIEAAAAVEKYRNASGQWPSAPPPAPLGLYSGSPFLYRTAGRGYLIYSPGPDLSDDHAAPLTRDGDAWKGDVVFRASNKSS